MQREIRTRFGAMALSAVLKKGGHQCEMFIQSKSKNIVQDVLDYKPNIIAFSTMTANNKLALNWAVELRKFSDAFIIMGGPHPTFFPEVIKQRCLDAICIGEGEYAFLELANRIDRGHDFTNIKNLWVKRNGNIYKNDLCDLVDINELPIYDRELYYDKYLELRDEPTKSIFLVRGCPFSCTYCFNNALKKMYAGKGQYIRCLDVDKAIAEIKYVRDKYGMKWLQIITDTLNVNREWFMTFLDRYKQEIDIPFLCNVRIDLVDEEMVKKMKEAKCDRIDFAIEHGDEWIRKNILKRDMTDKQIVGGGRLFNKYKIRVQIANIIGVPHETVSTAMKTVELNRLFKPEMARVTILQPYPRTEINEYAKDAGFLLPDYDFSESDTGFQIYYVGDRVLMPLKLKQAAELINIHYFFYLLVKHKWLEPLIKKLIKLPPNRIFRLIYVFPVVRQDIKYCRSFRRKMRTALILLKILIKGK